ncbi:MmcQ/YjbR family DNA-binding protein [Lutibacter sp. TH_r2]|uniref:MmcQ/YjbR family DNA-binding protein n=1 Tax=Lutibacter sp. TH_r2 TaxID=3082083 RepID=UPI002952E960|nr:MmcQ/YjbR family DNA-binding protein [Lutibacter sp. TH_r2]MDV7187690.1 MmcQ/YjbR family DNA-binding protein [Lutibacter sp. TH_r2]
MNIEQFREYCLSKKYVSESFPFDDQALVFKVADKMFALTALNRKPSQVNLKCDPERALELREEYSDIFAGYHMSKKHWNTLILEGNLTNKLILELIDHSYNLVVKGMTKKKQKELGFL